MWKMLFIMGCLVAFALFVLAMLDVASSNAERDLMQEQLESRKRAIRFIDSLGGDDAD